MVLRSFRILYLLFLFFKLLQCEWLATVTRFSPSDVDFPDRGDSLPLVFHCGEGSVDNASNQTWLARLRYERNEFGCGGAVLNNRYILTAASCLKGEVTQRLGSLISVTLQEANGNGIATREYEIEETVAHSEYVPNIIHGNNDVALIRLAKIINLAVTTPICVNGFPIDKSNAPYVAGWGQTFSGQQVETSTPQQLRIHYIDEYNCAERLAQYEYTFAEQDICTEVDSIDYDNICPLDGGGGLYKNVLSRWFLIGIAPYNGVCGHYIVPGVYTKFTDIYKWAVDNLRA